MRRPGAAASPTPAVVARAAKVSSTSALARSPIACTAAPIPCRAARAQERQQLVRRHQQHTAGLRAGQPGVGVVAAGRAGVERAVGDDLERPHRQQSAGARHDVAAAQTAGDRPVRAVQRLRPHRRHHPQRVGAPGDPGGPGVELPRRLVVDDPDHAPRGRGPARVGAPAVEHGGGPHVDHDRHPVPLADQPGGMVRHAVAGGGGRVEPAAVQVRGHQHDRYGTGDRVEQVAVRRVGPQRVAEPVPDQHRSRLGRVRPEPGGDQLPSPRRRSGPARDRGDCGRASTGRSARARPTARVAAPARRDRRPARPPARAGPGRSRRRRRRRRGRRSPCRRARRTAAGPRGRASISFRRGA